MKKIFPIVVLLLVTVLFFYKTFFFGKIPFPGDILISEYQPWRSFAFNGYAPGSYPNKAQYFDTIRQLYPWKELAVQQLKQGVLPLWNPYNFSGTPLMANIQSAVFYPTTLISLISPLPFSWTLTVLLQPFLAACGTFLFVRRLKISTLAALFSAISYGFSLYMSVFLEYNTIGHVILWLPFCLWCIESWIELKKIRYSIGTSITICLAAFAGHLQLFFGIILFVSLYLLYKFIQKEITSRNFLFIYTAIILGVLLASIQLIPTSELVLYSARSSHDATDLVNRLLIQPKQIIMFFSPDIYGNPATRNYMLTDSYPGKALFIGITSIFFFSIILRKKIQKKLLFYVISIIGILFFTIHHPLSTFIYTLPIPLLNGSSPTNLLFLFSFCLSVLAAFGFEDFFEKKRYSIQLVSITFICGFLFFLGIQGHVLKSQAIITFGSCIALWALVILNKISYLDKRIIKLIFILLLTFELWYFFQKFNPFVPQSLLFPKVDIIEKLREEQQFNRSWGYGSANIEANFTTQLKLYSPDGYDPLYPKWYGEFISISKNGSQDNIFTRQTRSDARIYNTSGPDDFFNNNRTSILNLLGVKYLLIHTNDALSEKELLPKTYQPIIRQDPLAVYKNNDALPRVLLLKRVDNKFSVDTKIESSSGSARIISYKPSHIRIQVQANEPGYLFISDTYFPGWSAAINGEKTTIQKTFSAFRSIAIPAGEYIVDMYYRPISVIIGSIVSIISGLLLAIISLYHKKRSIKV